MVMICPYCDIEINEKLIEAEDGCCPECGALITATTVIHEDDEDFDSLDDADGDEDTSSFHDEIANDDLGGGYDDIDDEEFKEDEY